MRQDHGYPTMTNGPLSEMAKPRGWRDLPIFLTYTLYGLDIFILIAAGWLSHAGYHAELEWPAPYIVLTLATVAAFSKSVESQNCYNQARLPRILSSSYRAIITWTIMVVVAIVVIFLLKVSSSFSRAWFLLWWVVGALGLVAGRYAIALASRRARAAGLLTRRAFLVGADALGRGLLDSLGPAVRIVGVFDDRQRRLQADQPRLQVDGTIAQMVDVLRRSDIDMVIVSLPSHAVDRVQAIVRQISAVPVEILLCFGAVGFRFNRIEAGMLGDALVVKVVNRPFDHGGWLIKRIEDLVIATAATVLLAPVCLAIAIAIRLESSGPAMFVQTRVGLNGRRFDMYKFRTMRTETAAERETVPQARQDDARITRVGRWLRRTSLDELPQFVNVLKGEMSVIGPRPHAERHDQHFSALVADYPMRGRATPGITGWAQVNGYRGLTDTDEKITKRVEYDIWYIDNWSLTLDIKIILMTIFGGMSGKNAF